MLDSRIKSDPFPEVVDLLIPNDKEKFDPPEVLIPLI